MWWVQGPETRGVLMLWLGAPGAGWLQIPGPRGPHPGSLSQQVQAEPSDGLRGPQVVLLLLAQRAHLENHWPRVFEE